MPLIMPLSSHRYLIGSCPEQITHNAVSVTLDFVSETVIVETRLTVEPDSFKAAMQFAHTNRFTLEFLDGTSDGAYYGLDLGGLDLIKHDLKFDYAEGGWAPNVYTFKYRDIAILYPKPADEPEIRTEGFMTPAEAVEKLAAGEPDATGEQESFRFGDGC